MMTIGWMSEEDCIQVTFVERLLMITMMITTTPMTMTIGWSSREDCIQAVGNLSWEGEYAIMPTLTKFEM